MAATTYTAEDRRLMDCLADSQARLRQLIDEGRPYVWELRLSQRQFLLLETAMADSISSHAGDWHHLLGNEDFAVIIVIYLAEWYKRRYKGTDTEDDKLMSLTTDELKQLYQTAGIDSNTFVYNASKNPDKTSYRWLESLQVLGGLAVRAELKRDQNDALLPQLCKIFHGEEIELDDLKDRSRAVAFQESISRRHSLYEYLDCILSKEKEPPFAQADIADESTCIPQLLRRIQEADEVAKKYKFDFEWVITYTASRNQMVRHLRVRLKPEEIGGGKKQYIGYDRLMKPEWGIEHPEEVGRIRFYLRFKNGGHYVRKIEKGDEPLFKYDNTGSERTGFLSVNKIDENSFTDVPVAHFDKVEMMMRYDLPGADGASRIVSKVVQVLEVKDYMQVYALPKTSNKFTTRKNAQAATAVVFSPDYHLAESCRDLPVVYAHFRNGEECSPDYCWCAINDKVMLTGPDGNEIVPPFFNRNGLYQVMTRKYPNTIKYRENVFVLYQYRDPDMDEDELQEDNLPVLFGRSGLEVRHYATGTAKEGEAVTEYDLEWLKDGRYVDWDKEEPARGAIRLRVTVKDIVFRPQVYYVPFCPQTADQQPIWRDFDHKYIRTALEGVSGIPDDSERLSDAPSDTLQLTIGDDNARILVDVYRPIILRELSQTDSECRKHVVERADKGEYLHIPLINCEQFSVRDFSENGVKVYQMERSNRMFYSFPTFNDYHSAGNYIMEVPVSRVSPELPLDYLMVYISRVLDAPTELYAWNYKTAPRPVTSSNELTEDGIVFQSLKDQSHPRHYAFPYIRRAQGGWGGRQAQVVVNALECFETVAEHRTYFFLFNPLIRVVHERNQIVEILLPLMKKRSYRLTEQDVEQLYRFAVQFHFDWMLLPRETWVTALAKSEEESTRLTEAVTDFFSKTPKCTDEREQAHLRAFLKKYWTFDAWQNVEDIADKALKLMLDRPDALGKYSCLRDLLKVYDECRYKFSEMDRAVVTNDNK